MWTGGFGLNVLIGYALMLVVMTYDVGLLLGVVLGEVGPRSVQLAMFV
jgi:hypothetical protein